VNGNLCENCARLRPPLALRRVVSDLDLPIVDSLERVLSELGAWLAEQERFEEGVIDDVQDRVDNHGDAPFWPVRPIAHEYCGYVPQNPGVTSILNPQAMCPTYDGDRPRPARRCADCRFHRPVPDYASELAANVLSDGSQHSQATLQAIRGQNQAIAANEVVEAVKSKGIVRTEPEQLPVCDRLSKPPNYYVVGPIANWTLACGYWESKR
jgi:hypothetical protein